MKIKVLLRNAVMLTLIISMLVSYTFATSPEGAAEDNTPTSGCYSIDAVQQLIGSDLQIKNVTAAFLFETTTNTLMYALNPDTQLPPSSLVKIMTALLVVEKGDLTDVVTVQQSTLDSMPIGAASAKLQPGENITLGDLLYCMIVGSANDAAAVMAEHIAGSQGSFITMMTERAAELGCTATTFVNVHGLHNDQQVTTVRDVARILTAAMENELFRAVFATESYTVPATNLSEQRHLSSSNYLFNKPQYQDERVTGGRTGIANDGTRCLAATAESNGMKLVSVVMGAKSEVDEKTSGTTVYGSFLETKQLLDAGFTGYKPAQILYEGQVLTRREVTGGENMVSIGPSAGVYTILPAQVTLQDLSFRYEDGGFPAKAPLKAGDRITGVEVWYGGLCVAKTDLFAMNDVGSGKSFSIGQTQEGVSKVWTTVLLVIVAIACIAIVIMLMFRFSNRLSKLSAEKRSRRRRQSRRRS